MGRARQDEEHAGGDDDDGGGDEDGEAGESPAEGLESCADDDLILPGARAEHFGAGQCGNAEHEEGGKKEQEIDAGG